MVAPSPREPAPLPLRRLRRKSLAFVAVGWCLVWLPALDRLATDAALPGWQLAASLLASVGVGGLVALNHAAHARRLRGK